MLTPSVDELIKTKSTRYLQIGNRYYCTYCGKELVPISDSWIPIPYDRGDSKVVCDCADAQKEIEITNKIKELLGQLPHNQYCIKTSSTSFMDADGDYLKSRTDEEIINISDLR